MNKSLAEELTQAVGQSTSGAWRTIAGLKALGVPKALGLSDEEWLKKYLGNYIQLAVAERYDAVLAAKEAGLSNRQIAKAAGVGESTVRRNLRSQGKKDQRKQKKRTVTAPYMAQPLTEIAAVTLTEEQTIQAREAVVKADAIAEARVKREASRKATQRPDGYQFHLGDARDLFGDVPQNSVHLVLTDPPYGDEAEPLYRWLAMWSARVLVDGGSLICFTGQAKLDRDLQILGEHLRYWWLLAIRHNQAQRLPGKFVMAEFKPVMWFVKGHRRGRTLVNDVLRSDRRDKAGHDWGQGDGGVELLIEQLTDPDELIMDPFAGTGQWGHIAARMGRRWIGCDVVDGGSTVIYAAE